MRCWFCGSEKRPKRHESVALCELCASNPWTARRARRISQARYAAARVLEMAEKARSSDPWVDLQLADGLTKADLVVRALADEVDNE